MAFTDLGDSFYAEEIAAAAQYGLVNGVSADRFAPEANITRQEIATLVERALSAYAPAALSVRAAAGDSHYTDHEQIAPWAADGIAALAAEGLLTGYPDGSFAPRSEMTRAEAAVLIARFYDARFF
ncbi:S-layer homology domain-containing protein [Paenibacillus sp. IB182496]|uniref:S-layer homology domain-containing protein n=1 Tax=Paenibacillus sabuli TaxID=2772509 RepID=A0A927BQM9_9BACL|nr:S-layer homology domain-containing protein [Paenibacillus sabuli]MBD2843910.1 S-layer homology domain-containing protein [Paenibacillus sabuli]